MKYLVTGGAGFIGSNIVKKLVARGDNVTVIDNLNTGKKENLVSVIDKISFLKDSILNINLLEQETEGIDGIFHSRLAITFSLNGNSIHSFKLFVCSTLQRTSVAIKQVVSSMSEF